jgi:hypothetical protein
MDFDRSGIFGGDPVVDYMLYRDLREREAEEEELLRQDMLSAQEAADREWERQEFLYKIGEEKIRLRR